MPSSIALAVEPNRNAFISHPTPSSPYFQALALVAASGTTTLRPIPYVQDDSVWNRSRSLSVFSLITYSSSLSERSLLSARDIFQCVCVLFPTSLSLCVFDGPSVEKPNRFHLS